MGSVVYAHHNGITTLAKYVGGGKYLDLRRDKLIVPQCTWRTVAEYQQLRAKGYIALLFDNRRAA